MQAIENHDLRPPARRVAMLLKYDGTEYLGWQRQPGGRTVQGVLEGILTRINSDVPVSVVAAGRTDSGVHAEGQVAHADISTEYPDARLLHAVRRMSPQDLAVARLVSLDAGFHARFRASSRSYRYRIHFVPDPFLARYSTLIGFFPDPDLLDAAAEALLGEHDFTTLSKHNPDTENPICNVTECRWHHTGRKLELRITANRFLYGMVRLVVGMQLDIARGKRPLDELPEVIAARDRNLQSPSAPAMGLTLHSVGYPDDPFARAVG